MYYRHRIENRTCREKNAKKRHWTKRLIVCVLAPAYTSLCRDLQYLLKVRYIIIVYPNIVAFLISNTGFYYGMETLSHVWKIHHNNEQHLRLVAYIVTKLSQIVCLIDTNTLICWHARCNYNLKSKDGITTRKLLFFDTISSKTLKVCPKKPLWGIVKSVIYENTQNFCLFDIFHLYFNL